MKTLWKKSQTESQQNKDEYNRKINLVKESVKNLRKYFGKEITETQTLPKKVLDIN